MKKRLLAFVVAISCISCAHPSQRGRYETDNPISGSSFDIELKWTNFGARLPETVPEGCATLQNRPIPDTVLAEIQSDISFRDRISETVVTGFEGLSYHGLLRGYHLLGYMALEPGWGFGNGGAVYSESLFFQNGQSGFFFYPEGGEKAFFDLSEAYSSLFLTEEEAVLLSIVHRAHFYTNDDCDIALSWLRETNDAWSKSERYYADSVSVIRRQNTPMEYQGFTPLPYAIGLSEETSTYLRGSYGLSQEQTKTCVDFGNYGDYEVFAFPDGETLGKESKESSSDYYGLCYLGECFCVIYAYSTQANRVFRLSDLVQMGRFSLNQTNELERRFLGYRIDHFGLAKANEEEITRDFYRSWLDCYQTANREKP